VKTLANLPFYVRVSRLAIIALLVALFAPATILAQDADQGEEQEKVEVEERIVVTGSRIKRTDVEGAAPVDVITRDYIEQTGATSIDRILQELPAITGGALNTNISNGNDDRSDLTMRGLSSDNTLILLNGRRLVSHGRARSAPDLNTIPLQVVERIEVLKDGASAVYGSDAVAGVVNIITRSDFRGFEVPLYYGQSTRGDLGTQDYAFIYGTGNDQGSLMISGNYYDQEIIWSRDRDISDDADNSDFGVGSGYFNRSSATLTGYFSVPGLGVLTYDPSLGDGSDASHFRSFDNTVDRYNFREETPAVIPQSRANIWMSGDWEFYNGIHAFAEAYYIQTRTQNDLAPNPLFTAFNGFGPITVSADNRYNPFGVDISDVRRRVIESGNRAAERKGDNYRFLGGVRGEFGSDWEWDAYFLWHEDNRANRQGGALIGERVALALGPDDACQADPNCVSLNLFGGPGSITEEMLDYVATSGLFTGNAELRTLAFNTTGTAAYLPGGPIGLALGVEYREDAGEDNPDSLVSLGNTIGFTNFERTKGEREVTELYLEANFPFVTNVPGARLLELDVALRYSDYSDFGTNTSPKIGLRYQPINEVMIRATYSEPFKAPTIRQLFSGNTQSFPTLNDPLQPSADTRTQFLTIFGSNPDLQPEESEVFTMGLVVEPFDNFSFTFDYFDIDQTNVIEANAQFILDENARSGLFADRVMRDANGFLQTLIATPINVGRRQVSGYDFSATYRAAETSIGALKFNLNGTYMNEWLQQADPSVAAIDRAGTFDGNDGPGSIPEYRANLISTLNNGPWVGGLTLNYIGDYTELEPLNEVERTVDSWVTADVQASYLFRDYGTRVTIGIDNLTDEAPPFSAQAFNDNFDGSMHNLIGSFWYMKVIKKF
jgi:iron complex outermembrane receptor protein